MHYFLFIPFQIGHYTVLIFGFLLFISLITALCFYKKWWRKLFKLKTGIWYFIERSNIANVGEIANPKDPIDTKNIDYDKAIKIAKEQIPNLKLGFVAPRRG